jgi:hypothetical protein
MRYVTRLSLSVLPEKAQNYSAMVSRSIAHTFRRVRPRDDTSFLAVTITMGSRSPWVPLRCVERPGHALTMVPSYLYSSFFARSAASSTCYSRRLTGLGGATSSTPRLSTLLTYLRFNMPAVLRRSLVPVNKHHPAASRPFSSQLPLTAPLTYSTLNQPLHQWQSHWMCSRTGVSSSCKPRAFFIRAIRALGKHRRV